MTNSTEPAQREEGVVERLDDRRTYHYLMSASAQAQELSSRCWSQGASRTLVAASRALRMLASALYRIAFTRGE